MQMPIQTAPAELAPDQRIRVLQVVDKFGIGDSSVHGTQRLIQWWIAAFHDTEFVQTVCALRACGQADSDCAAAGLKVEYLRRHRFDPRTLLDLLRIIKRDRIQVLHCHGYGASNFGRIAGKLCNIPVLVHEHFVDPRMPYYQRLADHLLARWTTHGIAISKAVYAFQTGPRHIPDQRMSIVYNAIPADYCRPIPPRQQRAVAQRYGIPSDAPLVGIIGRLDPVKGHADFLAAAALIRQQVPDAFFIIVGDGALRPALEQQAEALDLRSRVVFTGHCEQVAPLLSLLDVLVISSLSEGFSLAAVEGMAQGKAVVATAVGGLPEVIEHERSGLLVPPCNPPRLAAAVTRLLQIPQLRQTLGQQAQAICQTRFLVPRTVNELGRIYREVVTRATPHR